MIDRLVNALVDSKNEAADDALLEALRLGAETEQAVVLSALIRRKTLRGLAGAVALFPRLPQSLQLTVLTNIGAFQQALREAGRSDDPDARIAAMQVIALGRQGRLAYVLGENLHDGEEAVSKTACETLVALARWVATDTRRLQKEGVLAPNADPADPSISPAARERHAAVTANRAEIEAAVARALDAHRGRHGQDLLRAALLLCDWPGSKTLAILHTHRHGGQSPMIRRLQQAPAAEHVEAFLLAATHAQVRSHFGQVFTHIGEAPVLDALLRKTHWLKDHQLQICMHLVNRGVWWDEKELARDLERRIPSDAARIGEWIAVSQVHDVLQDDRLERLRQHAAADLPSRLRLLRVAMRRRRGASVQLIKTYLADPDERLARLAARELVRRKPPDYENVLLPLMTTAPLSVRKVISRAIGHAGFEQFWTRFDRMDKPTRRQAGRAMLKLLPDGLQRLARRLEGGPADGRNKALQIVQELGLVEQLLPSIAPLAQHHNARVRSKAVGVLGELPGMAAEVVLDKALHDGDARVRANAIEVLEEKHSADFIPMLAERARAGHNRERANAIKALHRMKVGAARSALLGMLRDERGEHRVSALWALRQIGLWELIQEVGRIAKSDANLRVRRYALGVIRTLADAVETRRAAGQVAGEVTTATSSTSPPPAAGGIGRAAPEPPPATPTIFRAKAG